MTDVDQDLFSKLRFSYIEQVTKEKFLRAITSSPPILIDPAQNDELERQLVEHKAALKQQKADVAAQTARLGQMAKELVGRHEAVQARQGDLEALPREIATLQAELEELKLNDVNDQEDDEQDLEPHLSLPLDQTMELIAEREAQHQLVEEELEALRARLPDRTGELERLQRALRPLEQQKASAVAAAKEARKRREDGGMDELEGQGRWYVATTTALSAWLEAGG
jgi:chromosome segregation ATPase